MEQTLVVLAAGMGSRFGGLKQIEPVGPGGETIIDYSIYDALRAGFNKVVFIIRKDTSELFRETIGRRFENRTAVEYVFQELDMLPPGLKAPPDWPTDLKTFRKKPWGTAHAILMAAPAVPGPFAAINGDDFYGAHSFAGLAEHLRAQSPEHAMVGFILRNTLSEFGSVARGLCQVANGYLESITEITTIERAGPGAKYKTEQGKSQPLSGDEIVSMNMWGFRTSIFEHLGRQMAQFLEQHGRDEKREFYIPTAVGTLVAEPAARVKVLQTPDSWFGLTYREDRPRVMESIRRLISEGVYPEKLWATR